MTDLANMSDDDLQALHAKLAATPPVANLAHMSDDDLQSLQAKLSAPHGRELQPSDMGAFGGGNMPATTTPQAALEALNVGAGQIGRGVPGAGLATKAGYGLSAFLSSITPDTALPETLRGKTIGELYDHFKEQDKQTQAKLMGDHPVAAAIGGGLGALTTPLPGAGMAGLAGAATRVGGLAAITALDQGTKNPDQVFDPAAAGKAGGAAGLVGSAVEAIPVVGKLAAPLSEFAENRAASALGMTKGIRNKIGNDAANQAGRVALDEGVVTPFASTADKIERMQALQGRAGQQIGGVVDQLDQAGVKAFAPGDVAMQVESDLGPTYGGEPLFKSQAAQYENLIDTILKRGDQPISFAEAQNLKQMLGQYGYREGATVAGREQAQQAYGIVNQALDDAVEKGASQMPNSPELLQTLQKAKGNYQASMNGMKGLENKQSAEQGNKYFGLTDSIVGSAAAASGALMHGGPAAALAAGGAVVAKKAAEKFGQNSAAWGADKIANILQNTPQMLGKYAPVLQEAAQRSPQSLAVAHYMLAQSDPEYQKLMDGGDPRPHMPAE